MKVQAAPYIAGYRRVIVVVKIDGKYMALDWISADANGPKSRI